MVSFESLFGDQSDANIKYFTKKSKDFRSCVLLPYCAINDLMTPQIYLVTVGGA